MTGCGAVQRVTGRTPLVCGLPPGHAGDHGVCQAPGLSPYVTWPRTYCTAILHTDGAHVQRCVAEAVEGSVSCPVHTARAAAPALPAPRRRHRQGPDDRLPWSEDDWALFDRKAARG